MTRTTNRLHYIDYLRGFMVFLVVFDHSIHAYSQHFADFWFIKEVDRSVFIDVLHMHNDAIMMPFLFFLAGMFVIPSYERRGLASFALEKFLRLVVPFVVGIHFVACFMVYHKKIISEGLDKGFFDFYWHDYLYDNIAQGGYWFLYFLLLMTVGLLILYVIFPRFVDGLGAFARWLANNPVKGFIAFGLLSAVILLGCDLYWGAHWWFGFGKTFYLRGSRWIIKIVYFALGAGVAQAGLNSDPVFLRRLSDNWRLWTLLAMGIGAIYISYSLGYFTEGAYARDLRYHFYLGGTWEDAWPAIAATVPMVSLRTTLLGLFLASATVAYLAVFARFLNKPHPIWQSLATCSFGIYLIHEPFSSGMHLWMYGSPTDPVMKAFVSTLVSLLVSWLLIRFVFLKLPGFKRVL